MLAERDYMGQRPAVRSTPVDGALDHILELHRELGEYRGAVAALVAWVDERHERLPAQRPRQVELACAPECRACAVLAGLPLAILAKARGLA